MATQLIGSEGNGVRYTLTTGGEYVLAEGARIISFDNAGIVFTPPNSTLIERLDLTIAGRVRSVGSEVIRIAGTGDALDTAFIRVTQTGSLSGFGSGFGIQVASTFNGAVTVENAGFITAGYALWFDGQGRVSVTNSGLIFGEDIGVRTSASAGALILRNSGQIVTGLNTAITSGGANDQVFNSGRISGGVRLGLGDDLYDGRGGQVIGLINGEDGDDRFIPGAARDSIEGGDGEDLLDFHSTKGVKVALDGSFAGTGAAKDDVYTGIENIYGSLKGADRLRGDAAGNKLSGFGGADTLSGGDGNDVLTGGAGRDRLTGGVEGDLFVFARPSEGGDVITDFQGSGDTFDFFFVNLAGFGLSGAFQQGWYREGRTNQARDRNDHFIFRTTDTTLWFDADGRGGRGPVLLANLQAGAELDWNQFNVTL